MLNSPHAPCGHHGLLTQDCEFYQVAGHVGVKHCSAYVAFVNLALRARLLKEIYTYWDLQKLNSLDAYLQL